VYSARRGWGYLLKPEESQFIEVFKCRPQCKNISLKNVPIEEQLKGSFTDISKYFVNENIEWIGAQLASVNCESKNFESDISCFGLGSKNAEFLNSVDVIEINGFFTPPIVHGLLNNLCDLLQAHTNVPFVSLISNGFADVIVSWDQKNNEHGRHLSGENLFGIKLLQNGECLLWRIADEYDFGIEKL